MENYGCVTWSDAFIYRDPPSYADREERALVLLHEMAHMWFGDMVTMRWWDDLWLNESFAEWACGWSAVGCTEFTNMWAAMLATDKQDAYAADAAPTTHPIRQQLVDVATAAASFDDITYPKGAAVLKQLVAFVGEDTFVSGLRSYFRKHAWGNTTLDDLIAELASASGRDLSGWVEGWLETSGTDRLTLERQEGGLTLVATPPDGRAPLPHRLQIGGYAARSEGLTLVETLSVEVAGERTRVDGGTNADLLLVNDEDLTFATVRTDPDSLEILLSRGGELPTAVGRTLALTTAWGLLYDGELTAQQFVDCGVGVLTHETADSVIEPLLGRLVDAADHWAPAAARDRLLSRVGDLCISLADEPGRRVAALRGLAQSATTAVQLEALADARDRPGPQVATAHPARRARSAGRVRSRVVAHRGPEPGRLGERPAGTHGASGRRGESPGLASRDGRPQDPSGCPRAGRSVLLAARSGGTADALRREVPEVPSRARRRGHAVGPDPVPWVLPRGRGRGPLPRPARRRCG